MIFLGVKIVDLFLVDNEWITLYFPLAVWIFTLFLYQKRSQIRIHLYV